MTTKLTTREKGDVVIVDPKGKLTLGGGTSALRRVIGELTAAGVKRILLNMADVSYIDSAGIGELVAAHMAVTSAGGEMKLVNLARRVHNLLETTKLYTVFETFEDEDLAIGSFSVVTDAELQMKWASIVGTSHGSFPE